MRIETHGQQIEVTPALRDYVETKLARLGKHYEQPLEVRTLLTLDKPDHRAEATVNISGKTLHADARAIDMYAAIDLLVDKLDRLLVKHKEKLADISPRHFELTPCNASMLRHAPSGSRPQSSTRRASAAVALPARRSGLGN